MQFVAKEDTDAPMSEMFAAISDFASFERSAIRRGVEVERRGDVTNPGNGLGWDAKFRFRGAVRDVTIEVDKFNPDTDLRILSHGSGVVADVVVELIELAPRRTRMNVTLKLKPKTLTGRLMVQSLKLARGKIARKFKTRVSEFAQSATERRLQAM